MDKIDPTLMSYLKGPYGTSGLPSITDVSLMQKALPGYGKFTELELFSREIQLTILYNSNQDWSFLNK